MPLNASNQYDTEPSNKTKPYKYTTCASREEKKLLELFWLKNGREVNKKAKRNQSKASHTRARRG
jgi:hypothetical protein